MDFEELEGIGSEFVEKYVFNVLIFLEFEGIKDRLLFNVCEGMFWKNGELFYLFVYFLLLFKNFIYVLLKYFY